MRCLLSRWSHCMSPLENAARRPVRPRPLVLASHRRPASAAHAAACPPSRPCRHRRPPSSPPTGPTYPFQPASTNHTPAFLPPLPGRPRRVTSLRAIDSQGGPPSWKCYSRDAAVSPRSSSPPAIPHCPRPLQRRCVRDEACLWGPLCSIRAPGRERKFSRNTMTS